jgi:hypothetical protein
MVNTTKELLASFKWDMLNHLVHSSDLAVIENRRRGMLIKGICLLHDISRPHMANTMKELLASFNHSSSYFPILLAMYCQTTCNDASS